MKTRIGQIATVTFFSLLISTGNIYADGTKTSALSHENSEETLKIENWMINERVWNANDYITLEMESAVKVEVEEALEVENWMVDDEVFSMETGLMMELEAALEIEIEEAMEMEDWMISDKNFNIIIDIETETEQALELEDWMTDENIWNK
jgi:hypothetical protein